MTTRRSGGPPEALPKAIWSDTVTHYGDEPWPSAAIPLIVFTGKDRPRPAYREELKFSLRDERYVNFAARLRCGVGDKYGGGNVGLVHSPDGSEVQPGMEGQLVTISDIIIQQDSSVIISVIGDLDIRLIKSWMPRGLRGLQMAFIDVLHSVPQVESLLQACEGEADLNFFGRAIRAVPALAQVLSSGGPHTVFVPTNDAFDKLSLDREALLQHPELQSLLACHIVPGRLTCETFYSGRVLQALDGTRLHLKFGRWPRGLPSVNDVAIENMDISCTNGVIHTISEVLEPLPTATRRPHAHH